VIAKAYTALKLALITSVWCWCLTALHGVWSFGIVRDYFDGRETPFYPYEPATYATFFICALSALFTTFLACFVGCFAVPYKRHLLVIIAAWLLGAYFGATETAFAFISDTGSTWDELSLLTALFYHPIVTPIYLIVGIAGAVVFTRPLRRST